MSGRVLRVVVMTVLVGAVSTGPGLTALAWADDGPNAAASADPSATPAPDASATPAPDASASTEPAEPTTEPTPEPSDATSEPTDEPVDDGGANACGTPGPDGTDPCILYSTGGGGPVEDGGGGAVEKGNAPELPLTGLGAEPVLMGTGLVMAGLATLSLRRRRA